MKPHALILGDTLAGLVTAWQLCAADFTVTILKTNNNLHETPVSPTPPNETSDPLVLYGPHTHTDSLLRDLGISKQESNWKRISVECNTASSTLARFPTPPSQPRGIPCGASQRFRLFRIASVGAFSITWRKCGREQPSCRAPWICNLLNPG